MGLFDFFSQKKEFDNLLLEIEKLSIEVENKTNFQSNKALELLKEKDYGDVTKEKKEYIEKYAKFVIKFNEGVQKDIDYLTTKLNSKNDLTHKIYVGNLIIDKYKYYLNLEFNSISIETIDCMNGQEFENFLIQKLLPIDGYKNIESTPYSNDYGVDIIAYKNNIRCAIQCKRYNNKISNSAIQEVVAGKKHYKCEKAIVITNNYYTENAKELAFDNQVELLDRDFLINLIKKIDTNK